MTLRASSQLKKILDKRGISIRQCAEMSGIHFETVRKMYNDDSKQYQRNTLGALCTALDVEIKDLLMLIEEEEA